MGTWKGSSFDEAQGRSVPSRRDGRCQPWRHHRRLAGDVPPGLRTAGRRDPQDRGQPHRPLRRLRGPAAQRARADHGPHGKGAAADRGGAGTRRPQARRSFRRRARRAHQEARHPAHLLHRPRLHGVPDQPGHRHEPRLSQGRVQGVPRFGVRGRQGHERRHRPVPGHGHAQDLQLLRPQGQRLHHRDLDRCPRQHRQQRLRLDEQVLLRGFLHRSGSLAPQPQGRRHLPDQRRRHLVAAAPQQEARSGAGRPRGQEPSRAGGFGRRAIPHPL